MITAVVTFKLPAEMTREKWREHNKSVSPRFQKIPGLIRKQFLYDGKGSGGGMYLWESREAAEACYQGPWKDAVAAIARSEPQIAWFETAVIVDNESHQCHNQTETRPDLGLIRASKRGAQTMRHEPRRHDGRRRQ